MTVRWKSLPGPPFSSREWPIHLRPSRRQDHLCHLSHPVWLAKCKLWKIAWTELAVMWKCCKKKQAETREDISQIKQVQKGGFSSLMCAINKLKDMQERMMTAASSASTPIHSPPPKVAKFWYIFDVNLHVLFFFNWSLLKVVPFALVWWDCFNLAQNWPRGVSFDFRSLMFVSSFSALIHLVGFFARVGSVFALVFFLFFSFCRVPLCCLLD